ncbi:MAG: helix-turn-helix domain-containing protein [Bacteroidales bacterium]|nr:helix-turn-helix domain-containing protein [Bacteroidales bacterium]
MEKTILISLSLEEFKELVKESVMEIYIEQEKERAKKCQDDKMLTRKEVANFLRISLPTLHQYQKDGRLKYYRIGRRVLFKKSEILDSIEVIRKYQRRH